MPVVQMLQPGRFALLLQNHRPKAGNPVKALDLVTFNLLRRRLVRPDRHGDSHRQLERVRDPVAVVPAAGESPVIHEQIEIAE